MKIKALTDYLFFGLIGIFLLLINSLNNSACGQHSIRFAENKGQWNDSVLFRSGIPDGAVFLEKNSILFHFRNNDFLRDAHFGVENFEAPEFTRHHAFRIKFVGAAKKPECVAVNAGSDYENYFIGSNRKKWASRVQLFESLVYKALYPGIDLIVKGNKQSMKYDFVIHRGSKAKNIEIEYEGLKSIYLKRKNLYLKTSLNEIVEMKPVAYQMDGVDSIPVRCRFKLRRNKVSFKFPDGYNKNLDLIIDPHLVFSTYSGSTADNWGFTATFDSKGNVYSGGIVADVGYPVSTGAFQEVFAGGDPGQNNGHVWDVAIIKYDSTGTQRLWASYLGGNGDEMPHSLVVDSQDNLHVLGTTGSDNFPTSFNAFDTTFNGGGDLIYCNAINFSNGVDIFITKITEAGDSIIASTYVGGDGNDGINFRPRYGDSLKIGNGKLYYNYGDGARGEIITGTDDYVYVGSCTFSDNFPVQDPIQIDIDGAFQDGVVFKMPPDLSELTWSTYLGGVNDDAVFSIDLSANGNVIAAGGTNSKHITVTSQAFHPDSILGETDGFVTIISHDGSSIVASSFFGTDSYDQIYFVRADEDNNVFITGQTEAPDSTLIFNAHYSNYNSGQFIAKLSQNLDTLLWSTVFGTGDGAPDISITAFAVDLKDRIYLSGWGREWFSGSLWSYFTGIKNMETTPTAFQPESDGQDFYVMVMSDDASCLEYATFFGEKHYSACEHSGRDHVDGGTSRFDKRGYIYQAACASCGGCQKFPVMPNPGAWSTQNQSQNCNNAVFKFEFESPDYLPDVHRCNDDTARMGRADLTADPDLSFSWSPANLLLDPTVGNPVPIVQFDTVFSVEVTKGFCTTTYYQRFYQHYLELQVPGVQEICDIDSMLITAELQLGLAEIIWSSNSGYTDTLNNLPSSFYVQPNSSTFYYCQAANQYCFVEDSVQFIVYNVSVNAQNDFTICYGDRVELNAISEYPGQTINYIWTPQDVILEGANTASPVIYIEETTEFTVQAINYNLPGCEDSDVILVSISPFSISTNEIILETADTIFQTQSVLIQTQTSTLLDYHWNSAQAMDNPAKPNILATPVESGFYYVTVSDEFGCWRKDSIYIFVEDVYCNEDYVFVPNAFSPNNDSKNDILFVQSIMTNDIYFAVYNRWGEKLFETTNILQGWDGSYKGKEMPNGVYVFYLKATCWNSIFFEKKGNVTLLR